MCARAAGPPLEMELIPAPQTPALSIHSKCGQQCLIDCTVEGLPAPYKEALNGVCQQMAQKGKVPAGVLQLGSALVQWGHPYWASP